MRKTHNHAHSSGEISRWSFARCVQLWTVGSYFAKAEAIVFDASAILETQPNYKKSAIAITKTSYISRGFFRQCANSLLQTVAMCEPTMLTRSVLNLPLLRFYYSAPFWCIRIFSQILLNQYKIKALNSVGLVAQRLEQRTLAFRLHRQA